MRKDKNLAGVYWHGGKMYFTGGAMMGFMGNNRSEMQGSNLPTMEDPNVHWDGAALPNMAMDQRFGQTQLASISNPTQDSFASNPVQLTPTSNNPNPISQDGQKSSGSSFGSIAGVAAPLIGAGLSLSDNPNTPGMSAAKGALSGAAAGAALGPWGALAGGVIGGGLGLVQGQQAKHQAAIQQNSLGRQQYGMATQGQNLSGHIYSAYGGPIANEEADGGNMYASQTNPLTRFNVGGTHEQNPNGGVPQGVNPSNGEDNLVEQGETKYNNYIFSDRLKLENPKEYLLGGGLGGKTFADVSKKLSKLADERPNDPITQLGQKKTLDRLKQANDDAIQMKQFADQNQQMPSDIKAKGKFEYGGYIFKDI